MVNIIIIISVAQPSPKWVNPGLKGNPEKGNPSWNPEIPGFFNPITPIYDKKKSYRKGIFKFYWRIFYNITHKKII